MRTPVACRSSLPARAGQRTCRAWWRPRQPLPVIGIPRALADLDGLDSLLSIVQMPGGVPVATVSIGGAKNAGLLAARILGATDPAVQRKMVNYQENMAKGVERKDQALRERLLGGE